MGGVASAVCANSLLLRAEAFHADVQNAKPDCRRATIAWPTRARRSPFMACSAPKAVTDSLAAFNAHFVMSVEWTEADPSLSCLALRQSPALQRVRASALCHAGGWQRGHIAVRGTPGLAASDGNGSETRRIQLPSRKSGNARPKRANTRNFHPPGR